MRRPLRERCKIQTTSVQTKTHQGRNETLGHREDSSNNHPFRLREKILTGRLKIKQAHGPALPPKRAISSGKSQKQTQPYHHPHNVMDGGQVHDGTSRDNELRNSPRQLSFIFWSLSGEPPKVATRAGGEKTLTAPSTLFLHMSSLVCSAACQDFSTCFHSAHSSLGLCFVLASHRHSRSSVVDAVLLSTVLQDQFRKERVIVSIPHPYTALLAHSVIWWLQKTFIFHISRSQASSECGCEV